VAGGLINSRIASKTTRNWLSVFGLKCVELRGGFLVDPDDLTESDKRADHVDARSNCCGAVQDRREHHGTVLGERVWLIPSASAAGL
jgi:hypothetical protein